MDLVGLANKCIKAWVEGLEVKIRSKRDLYYIFRQWWNKFVNFVGQYYLPDENNWSIRSLKYVLSWNTKVDIHINNRLLNKKILRL